MKEEKIKFSWAEIEPKERERIGHMYCFKYCENWAN